MLWESRSACGQRSGECWRALLPLPDVRCRSCRVLHTIAPLSRAAKASGSSPSQRAVARGESPCRGLSIQYLSNRISLHVFDRLGIYPCSNDYASAPLSM